MIIIFCFLPFLFFLCYSGRSWYCRIQGRSWTQRRDCKLWQTFSVYLIYLWSRVYPGLGQKLSPVSSSCSPQAKSRPRWEKHSLLPPKCVSSISKGSDPDGVKRLQQFLSFWWKMQLFCTAGTRWSSRTSRTTRWRRKEGAQGRAWCCWTYWTTWRESK